LVPFVYYLRYCAKRMAAQRYGFSMYRPNRPFLVMALFVSPLLHFSLFVKNVLQVFTPYRGFLYIGKKSLEIFGTPWRFWISFPAPSPRSRLYWVTHTFYDCHVGAPFYLVCFGSCSGVGWFFCVGPPPFSFGLPLSPVPIP